MALEIATGTDIVQQAAEEQQAVANGETVSAFTAAVERRVGEKLQLYKELASIEGVQNEVNIAAAQAVGDATKGVQSYSQTIVGIYGQGTKVDDLSAMQAAGVNDKSDNSVAVDVQLVGANLSASEQAYGKRVIHHEHIHQNDQATVYNRDSISYVSGPSTVTTVGVDALTEWQPSKFANIESDLVPEYIGFVDQGDDLARHIGSDGEAKIISALKTGDMQGLQQSIIDAQTQTIVSQSGSGSAASQPENDSSITVVRDEVTEALETDDEAAAGKTIAIIVERTRDDFWHRPGTEIAARTPELANAA